MRERTHTEESLTAQGKTTTYNRLLSYLKLVQRALRYSLCVTGALSSLCILQAHLEERGPICIPEGCNMSCFSHCSSFRYCTGCLLSWGRGDASRFVGIGVIENCGGGFVVSVQITCCFNLHTVNDTIERAENTEKHSHNLLTKA